MQTLGFIGAGTIGAPMAGKLIEHGHTVHVYDVNPTATAALTARGAVAARDVAGIAKLPVVFLSLPGPKKCAK